MGNSPIFNRIERWSYRCRSVIDRYELQLILIFLEERVSEVADRIFVSGYALHDSVRIGAERNLAVIAAFLRLTVNLFRKIVERSMVRARRVDFDLLVRPAFPHICPRLDFGVRLIDFSARRA